MELLRLAFCFFRIGLLSFGGGYSVLPLIEQYVVLENRWLTPEQFTDIITLSEVTPGPVALNAASFTGFMTAGFPGAVSATIGCVLPSLILVSVLAVIYVRHRNGMVLPRVLAMLRPAVCAVIFSSFFTIALSAFFGVPQLSEIAEGTLDPISLGLFLAAVLLLGNRKIHPVSVIFGAGLLGLLLY